MLESAADIWNRMRLSNSRIEPRIEGDRLIGRGAYDMKGALAAMMCSIRDLCEQDAVRVRFVCVPDEESEDIERRTSDDLVRRGLVGDFAITGEPTNLHVGIQAKGVLACRLLVHGRAAHGCGSWSTAPPPTARPRGSATTRS